MAYTCDTCHKELSSDGSLRIHQLVGHMDEADSGQALAAGRQPTPSWESGRLQPPTTRPGAASRILLGLLTLIVFAGIVGGAVFGVRYYLDSQKDDDLVAADGLSADGGSVDEGPVDLVPGGFKLVSNPEFTIAIPEGMEEGEDALMGMPTDILSSEGGEDHLAAVDASNGSGVFISSMPAPGVQIYQVPEGMFAEMFAEEGVPGATEQRVSLPAGSALRMDFTYSEDGGFEMDFVMYILVHNSEAWMIGYFEVFGDGAGPSASAVANTFQFMS